MIKKGKKLIKANARAISCVLVAVLMAVVLVGCSQSFASTIDSFNNEVQHNLSQFGMNASDANSDANSDAGSEGTTYTASTPNSDANSEGTIDVTPNSDAAPDSGNDDAVLLSDADAVEISSASELNTFLLSETETSAVLTASFTWSATIILPECDKTIDLGGFTLDCSAASRKLLLNSANTLSISNGTIVCNQTEAGNKYKGGFVCVENGGSLSLNSVKLQGCASSDNGGAIYFDGNTCNINNVTIQSCASTSNGGALYLNGGTCNITGGSIAGCSATEGGGVYVAGGSLSLGGTTQIMGNVFSSTAGDNAGKPCNVRLATGSTGAAVSIGSTAPIRGMMVGMYYDASDADQTLFAGNYADFFASDNTAYYPYYDNTNTVFTTSANDNYAMDVVWTNDSLESKPSTTHHFSCAGGWYWSQMASGRNCTLQADWIANDSGVDGSNWETSFSGQLGSATSETAGYNFKQGNIFNFKGITTAFDLNGHTIDRKKTTSHGEGRVFLSAGNLTLTSSTAGGKITGGYANTNGGGIYSKGTLTLQDNVSIEGNKSLQHGGGIYLSCNSFTMSGGTIESNTSNYGGGIYINAGSFSITGGEISSNTATSGGGIYVEGTSSKTTTFELSGGTIDGNYATQGGGIYMADYSKLAMSGGTVSNHTKTASDSDTAPTAGAGIYYASTSTDSEISGGTITANKATDGAGIYIASGALALNGGTIGGDTDADGNVATNNGGGVYYASTTAQTIDGATFKHNQSNVSVSSTDYTRGGGGVYRDANGSLTMKSGTITNNTAVSNGGGLHSEGAFTISGGTIGQSSTETASAEAYSNKAYGGAGVYCNGDFNMNGGSITYNYSRYFGGGIFLGNDDTTQTLTATFTNGTVGYNCSAKWGGGIQTKVSTTSLFEPAATDTINIEHNTALTISGNGGGGGINADDKIVIGGAGTVTIANNEAKEGAGIRCTKGTDTVSALCMIQTTDSGKTEIKDNTANGSNGGGVECLSGVAFTMTAGSITGNTAISNGGGVYVDASSSISLSGSPEVWDNTAGATDSKKTNNLQYSVNTGDAGGLTITGDLTSEAKVGVTCTADDSMGKGNQFAAVSAAATTTSLAAATSGDDTSDDTTLAADGDTTPGDTTLATATPGDASTYANLDRLFNDNNPVDDVTLFGVASTDTSTPTAIVWSAGVIQVATAATGTEPGADDWTKYATWRAGWSAARTAGETLADSDTVYVQLIDNCESINVGGDSETDADIRPTAAAVKDGKRYNFDLNGFTVNMNGRTVENSSRVFVVRSNTTLTVRDTEGGTNTSGNGTTGIIKDSTSTTMTNFGGAAVADSGCTLNILGGTWTGFNAKSGGAIQINSQGTIKMSGGVISSCKADNFGGGIHVSSSGIFEMSGNAKISGNEASWNSGGLSTETNSTFKMSGEAAISGNTADQYGGGARCTGTITMEDNATIKENIAKAGVGGISLADGTLTISDSASVEQNISNGNCGGVEVANGKFILQDDAKIDSNYAAKGKGGGVYVNTYGKLDIQGGTISNHTVTTKDGSTEYTAGAGIYCQSVASDCKISGGAITGNKATDGAGIYITSSGTFTMSGGYVVSNTAVRHGGGVYVDSSAKFNMTAGGIDSNTVTIATSGGYGGAAVFNCGTTTIGDGTGENTAYIRKNTSGSWGGGAYNYGSSANLIVQTGAMIGGSNDDANTASQSGGGIHGNGLVTMTGGEVSHNQGSNGGGISFYGTSGCALKISGGKVSYNQATSAAGGGVYLWGTEASMTCTISNTAQISYNTSKTHGGGIYAEGKWTTTMSGGTISSNTATSGNGGGVYNAATFTMTGGTIGNALAGTRPTSTNCSNSAKNGGGVYNSGTFEMQAGKVTYNYVSGNGGGVLSSGSTTDTNLTGGEITYNRAKVSAGGIEVDSGHLELAGVKVNNNLAEKDGGGVVMIGGTATMTAGEIKKNSGWNVAGGIYLYNSTASFTMEDGEISSNSATAGGAIDMVNTTGYCLLKGGTIKSNSCTKASLGGGINACAGGYVQVQGSPIVTGNTANSKTNNIQLVSDTGGAGGLTVTGDLGSDANIGVSPKEKIYKTEQFATVSAAEATTSAATNTALTAASDDATLMTATPGDASTYANLSSLINDNNRVEHQILYGAPGTDPDNPTAVVWRTGVIQVATAATGTEPGVDDWTQYMTWRAGWDAAIEAGETLADSDTVYVQLLEDCENLNADNGSVATTGRDATAAELSDGKRYNLDLNGFAADIKDRAIANNSRVFYVKSDTTLTVRDTEGGTNTSGDGTTGTIKDSASSSFTANGGAAYVESGSTLNIVGATWTGFKANEGGCLFTEGVVTMTGGAISSNTATSYGGGVYVNSTGQFDMQGGDIASNEADGQYCGGGGICNRGITIIGDGTGDKSANLKKNTATNTSGSYGGAIFNKWTDGDKAQLTIQTGALLGGSDDDANTAPNGGGGAIHNNGFLTMTGGEVSHNQGIHGGGISSASETTYELAISGGKISDNKATSGAGGGIELLNTAKSFTLSGDAEISGNTATTNGGGIYIENASEANTMSGGTVTGNSAPYGGGIYIAESTGTVMTMSGGAVSSNTATNDGGGIYNLSAFNLTGGDVASNTATSSGGGGYNGSTGVFTMSGGTIGDKSKKTAATATSGEHSNFANQGSAVYNTGTFTMTGGDVAYNYASHNTYGGGIASTGSSSVATLQGGTLSYNGAISGAAVWVYDGTLYLSGGTLTKNYAAKSGGAVLMTGAANATMSAGSITENTAYQYYGGAVDMFQSSGTLTIKDGTLSGNDAVAGGCIMLERGSESGVPGLDIQGGTIESNTAIARESSSLKGDGGGVFVMVGTVTMSGGTIAANTADTYGGGVFNRSGATFNLKGGTIGKADATAAATDSAYSNKAQRGGGVYNAGAFKMSGGNVYYNYATNADSPACSGGGIYTADGTDIEISGGNVSYNYGAFGAGLQVADTGKATLKAGTDADGKTTTPTFYKNNAQNSGGAVSLYGQATLNMSAGNLEGNWCSEYYGGAVYLASDQNDAHTITFTMSGGSIVGNHADAQSHGSGGGVATDYSDKGTGNVTITGGAITGNWAAYRGGGVNMNKMPGHLYISGSPVIYGNAVGSSASGTKSNVQTLTNDGNGSIVVTGDLDQQALVGVTCLDKMACGDQFATVETTATTSSLSSSGATLSAATPGDASTYAGLFRFVNDYNPVLSQTLLGTAGTGNAVVWGTAFEARVRENAKYASSDFDESGSETYNSLSIDNESSYTASFKQVVFDSNLYNLCVSFTKDIPVGARIVLQETKTDNAISSTKYYYYTVPTGGIAAGTKTSLTNFLQAGTVGDAAKNYAWTTTATARELRVWVDYGLANSEAGTDVEVSPTLTCDCDYGTGTSAGTMSYDSTASVKTSDKGTFAFSDVTPTTPASTSTRSYTVAYTPPASGVKATEWDGREYTLVLDPASGVSLPADAKFTAVVTYTASDGTAKSETVADVMVSKDGKVRIPFGIAPDDVLVDTTSGVATLTAQVTMSTQLSPAATPTVYSMTAKLYAASSDDIETATSPTLAQHAATANLPESNLLASVSASNYTINGLSSIKITCADDRRLVRDYDKMSFTLKTLNDENLTKSLVVEKKNTDGSGWTTVCTPTLSGTESPYTFAVQVGVDGGADKWGAGTYRVHVTLTNGATTDREAYYYFVQAK